MAAVDDGVAAADISDVCIADKDDDGDDGEAGMVLEQFLYLEHVAQGLLHGIVEAVLGDIGIALVPLAHISFLCDDNLRPFLAVGVSVYVATVVLRLYHEDAVYRDYDMVYLGRPVGGGQDDIVEDMVAFGQPAKEVGHLPFASLAFPLGGPVPEQEEDKGDDCNEKYYRSDTRNGVFCHDYIFVFQCIMK